MTLSFLFWILMLLWLIMGGVPYVKGGDKSNLGTSVLLYAIIFIIGIVIFGSPIK